MNEAEKKADWYYYEVFHCNKKKCLSQIDLVISTYKKPLFGIFKRPKKVKLYQEVKTIIENK